MVQAISDVMHKLGVGASLILSFTETHMAVFTLGLGFIGLLIRWYYDDKEDARREREFNSRIEEHKKSDSEGGDGRNS